MNGAGTLPGQPAVSRKRDRVLTPRQWGIALFALAAAMRLGYASLGMEVPAQDTPDYDEIAANLLAGEGFVARENWFGYDMRSWRAPLYPGFLAGVYGLFGFSHGAVKIAQSFLGAATAVTVYATARAICPQAALIAGVAASLYMPLVASASEVMTETLFAFLLVLALYLSISTRLPAGAGGPRLMAVGVAIGFAALTRPVALVLWPVEMLHSQFTGGGRWRRCLWITLGVAATVVPWTARNFQVHSAFVPISTHGGFLFARSNGPSPDWKQADGWRIEKHTFERMPGEVERDRYWLAQGIRLVSGDPALYLRSVGERFLRFWYFFQPGYNLSFMVILPLFAAGLLLFWRRRGFDLLAAVIVAFVFTFSTILYGSARFRLPLEPLFILFATAFAHFAWQRWGAARTAALLAGLVAANGFVWLWEDRARTALLGLLEAGGLK